MDTVWLKIDSAPENQVVMTRVDDGSGARCEQPMSRSGRLWFGECGSSTYYTPTHWRPLSNSEKLLLKNKAERKAIEELQRVERLYS